MSKISELTDGGSLLPTDTLIAVRSGANVKVVNDTINVTTLNPDQINMGDNEQIRLGNSQDLLIYHDGSNSLIQDAGTGDLILKSNGNATVIKTNAGNNLLSARDAGSVGIFYDGSEKLTTTSTGIDVTGTVTADGLTVDGDVFVSTSSSTTDGTDGAFVDIKNTDTTTSVVSGVRFLNGTTTAFKGAVFFEDLAGDGRGDVVIASNDVASGSAAVGLADQRLRISRSGDISFYEDTGTTAKFFWDASAESLGIGTTSPAAKIDTAYTDSAAYNSTSPSADLILSRKNTANTNNQTVGIRFDVTGWSGTTTGGAAIEAIQPSNASTADLAFLTRNAGTWGERMRIASNGNVGIGTGGASPTSLLHASSSGSTVLTIERTASGTEGKLLLSSATNENIIYSRDATTGAKPLRFEMGSSEAMRIDSSGHAIIPAGVTLGTAAGTYNAANTLDDYEEGTWTPTVAGDATGAFSTAEATYTKVGRLVFIQMYVVVSTNFTSNYIGGLPFTVGDFLTGTSLGQSAVVLTNAADTVTGAAVEAQGTMRFYNDHNTASLHNPNTTNGGYRLALCYQV